MSSLAPWSAFSPHTNTLGRLTIPSWSARDKQKGVQFVKPAEVTKASELKATHWDPGKKAGWMTDKERKQLEFANIMERLERKQGKSHKKENSQFFIRNALKQMKKLSEDSSVIPDPDVPRVFTNYLASLKDANKKLMGELDGPEIVISTTPRLSILRRSTLDPNVNQFLQDTFSSSRKISKMIDPSSGLQAYDRKMKNLIDKTPYIKPETSTLLKPEEVLSCRYLRLSKNNIQTLLRLCKEAGMDIDIHPHMNESEMNANKIFTQKPSIAL
ncbi:uncharacterized protein C16orf78 homolog [Antechinus flavipes]|uniref:uncharacterized protein C16orf78 homolog n=1 Tax=Antechinus flavipes TaxID=38775 RepID=UPI0022365306|nr:uncharacterized protein C16orf78 homolog [Antechinus flavipes]